MVPRVGQMVGPYEILGRLGSGGMGLVFSAWDGRLQRDVALKLLREEFATPAMRSRFLQEARAASRLNHPNICTIFDIGEQDGDPYLVMELLKGETVRSRISRGRIPVDDLVQMATETADALIVAHGHGIIHRDIKPANIMLVQKPNGRFQTKVLDFGLAKVEAGDNETTRFDLTSLGTTVGTVSYMSPEQAKGEPLDARSDLFSLGVVLYEMATGELPFQGATSALVFVQLLGQRPEPVREFNADVPKELEKFIFTLLEKKRSDRFQSAADVVEALHKLSKKSGGGGGGGWSLFGGGAREKPAPRSRRELEPSEPVRSRATQPGTPKSPAAAGPAAGAASGPPSGSASSEAFIRPVKRVPTGEVPRAVSNPEIPVPSASTFERDAAASGITPIDPTGSSGLHRPAPRGSSGMHASAPPTGSSGQFRPIAPPVQPPVAPQAPANVPPAVPPRTSSGVVSTTGASSSFIPARPQSVRPASDSAVAGASESARTVRNGPSEGLDVPALSLSRARRPVRSFERVEIPEDTESEIERRQVVERSKRGLIITLLLLVVAAAGGTFAWYQSTHHGPAGVDIPTSVLVAYLGNHTGDSTLDGALTAGLMFDLEQSPHLSVRHSADVSETDANKPSMDRAQSAAKAVGAVSVIYGELTLSGGSYVIAVTVYDAANGSQTMTATETTSSRQQVPDAVDRVAADVRSGLGESGDSIGKSSVALGSEATLSLDSLASYVAGEKALVAGKLSDALLAFRQAANDPNFTQADLMVAEIARRQHAETTAADAAKAAVSASSRASTRTQLLAQASNAIYAAGDGAQAVSLLQQALALDAIDVEAMTQMAVAQQMQGKYADALQSAQAALKLAPYDDEATEAAEKALIGQNSMSAAIAMEAKSQAAGHTHADMAALLQFLAGGGVSAPDPTATPDQLAPMMVAAQVLDARGQYAAGLAMWRTVEAQARTVPQLASSVSYVLGQAALDHAMAEDCAGTNGLLREMPAAAGPEAAFAGGVAASLCGNLDIARKYQTNLQSAHGYYLPGLTAVMQWKAGAGPDGLTTLDGAKQYDSMSILPYLRGLIHLDLSQFPSAATDFQTTLRNRGAVALFSPEVVTMAQAGLGKAQTH